jgi:hypothetical protein
MPSLQIRAILKDMPFHAGTCLAEKLPALHGFSLRRILMKAQVQSTMISVAAIALLAVTLMGTPAAAKQKADKHEKPATTTSAAAAASLLASVPQPPVGKSGQQDSKPGMAWKTVGGTVKSIQGETYLVEDYEGNQMKMHAGQATKRLRGNKKVGDTIRAEVTHGGFANSIQ